MASDRQTAEWLGRAAKELNDLDMAGLAASFHAKAEVQSRQATMQAVCRPHLMHVMAQSPLPPARPIAEVTIPTVTHYRMRCSKCGWEKEA